MDEYHLFLHCYEAFFVNSTLKIQCHYTLQTVFGDFAHWEMMVAIVVR